MFGFICFVYDVGHCGGYARLCNYPGYGVPLQCVEYPGHGIYTYLCARKCGHANRFIGVIARLTVYSYMVGYDVFGNMLIKRFFCGTIGRLQGYGISGAITFPGVRAYIYAIVMGQVIAF